MLRGLETFLQLVEAGPAGFQVPAVAIEDRPRFPWRGLLIDVARHLMPVEVIERNLDAMAAVKLNVLHWHLSEDQGFRVESRRYPKLHRIGSDGLFYTQDQIREVVAYARDRGIRVVPEFDMPGHATAWFVGYPELASAPGPYEIERRVGRLRSDLRPDARERLPRSSTASSARWRRSSPTRTGTSAATRSNGKQWNENPRIQAFKAAPRHGDQRGAAGVLQPAAAGDPREARQADGGLGRDPAPGPAQGTS